MNKERALEKIEELKEFVKECDEEKEYKVGELVLINGYGSRNIGGVVSKASKNGCMVRFVAEGQGVIEVNNLHFSNKALTKVPVYGDHTIRTIVVFQ